MGKLHTTLADDMLDPDRYTLKTLFESDTPKRIRQAHRMVLDEDACLMAISLSTDNPRKLYELISLCEPPYDKLWVEMSSNVVMAARRYIMESQGATPEEAMEKFPTRPPEAHMGVLIERDDDHIEIWCCEHEAGKQNMVFDWPVHYAIRLDGEKFDRMKQGEVVASKRGVHVTHRGKTRLAEQTALIWGYGEGAKGIQCLNNTSRIIIPDYAKSLFFLDERRVLNNMIEELTGITRLAVGVLALINGMPMTMTKTNPKGRRMAANRRSTKPLLSYSVATMVVPKRVTKLENYVKKHVYSEAAKKRFHEVRGHYRHLKEKPSTPGWKEVVVNGQTLWRKHIKAHHRGDIELGIVEHDETVVKGEHD